MVRKLIRLWKGEAAGCFEVLLDEVLCYPKWLFDPEIAQYTYLLKNTPLGVVENAPTQVLKMHRLMFSGIYCRIIA